MAAVGPGIPGHCPACDGLGYIDSIDIGHRYQIQHCKVCLHRWEYLFDADGRVVGLTELDDAGQPVSRSRIRDDGRAANAEIQNAADPGPRPSGGGRDEVLDLRDGAEAPAPTLDLTEPERLSPADWLRQTLRR